MYFTKSSIRLRHQSRRLISPTCTYVTTSYSVPAKGPSTISERDVIEARAYCSLLLQKFDSPSYTLQTFIPPAARDAYLSIRALNVELARIPDVVSNPTIGAIRMQFWRDNVTRTLANSPPKEPFAILFHNALRSLQHRNPDLGTGTMKGWILKIIQAREQYMDNRPYLTLDSLEKYAENTYSTLMYLTLAALPLHSVSVDHLASHVGKATGIVAVLRGIPLVAFPPPLNHHSNNSAFSNTLGGNTAGRQGAVLLPLDVMADTGVKEEEVLRYGSEASGLREAVFKVATRANDHLITAREMLRNLKQGRGAGHKFELEGEDGHIYADVGPTDNVQSDLDQGFGVLMPALSTRMWLERLEKADFDIFKPELRSREWTLPWKAFWTYSRRQI